jgi:ligand-binding sensor domain-containing protein
MNPIRHIGRSACIVFAATLCSVAFARESDRTLAQFAHTTWGANEGAPRNIQAITQTKDGYLLLGSAEGLFRFDGVAFEHYETPSGSALPSGAARFLLALPNGDLWIGFYSGAVSLLRNGTVQTYTTRDGLPDGHVLCLAQDREGTIWAGTSGGLARFEGNRWKGVGTDWSFPWQGIAVVRVCSTELHVAPLLRNQAPRWPSDWLARHSAISSSIALH